MAKIYLEPNEVFEHFHSEESYTSLFEGSADYICNGKRTALELNKPIYTKPNISHTVKNTGNIECAFVCGHGSGGGTNT